MGKAKIKNKEFQLSDKDEAVVEALIMIAEEIGRLKT